MYIYPDNLAAKATLWLWELKDLAIIGNGFLSIRFDNTSILDFIRYAAAYFFTRQQYFEWRNPT